MLGDAWSFLPVEETEAECFIQWKGTNRRPSMTQEHGPTCHEMTLMALREAGHTPAAAALETMGPNRVGDPPIGLTFWMTEDEIRAVAKAAELASAHSKCTHRHGAHYGPNLTERLLEKREAYLRCEVMLPSPGPYREKTVDKIKDGFTAYMREKGRLEL